MSYVKLFSIGAVASFCTVGTAGILIVDIARAPKNQPAINNSRLQSYRSYDETNYQPMPVAYQHIDNCMPNRRTYIARHGR